MHLFTCLWCDEWSVSGKSCSVHFRPYVHHEMAALLKAGLSVLGTHIHTHTIQPQIQAYKMPAGVSMTLSSTTLHLFCMRKRQTLKCWDDAVSLSFFFDVSVLVHSLVWVPEKALAESEREGASSGQSGPLYISMQAVWDTISSSVFGLFPTYTEEIPFRVLGRRWTSISPTSPIIGLPVWIGSH